MTQSDWGLDRLLDPVQRPDFAARYWGREPLVVRREDAAYFSSVLSLGDIDRILNETVPRHPHIRIVKGGRAHPISSLNVTEETTGRAAEAVFAEYRRGATIIVQFLDERWVPLGQLTEALGRDVAARVQANVYLTPAGSKGFNPHADSHDVFVMQLAGSKLWRLYGENEGQRRGPPTVGDPTQEFVLSAGDTLYVPTGHVHDAETVDETSLHITLGVLVMTWKRLISLAVERIMREDRAFASSLPLGFATAGAARREAVEAMSQYRDRLIDALPPAATIDAAAELFRAGARPDLGRHLLDLEAVGHVDASTKVCRRDIEYDLGSASDVVTLTFHGKTITLPGHVFSQVRFVCEGGVFTAPELPGDLDEEGRIVLISELLREGFLTLA